MIAAPPAEREAAGPHAGHLQIQCCIRIGVERILWSSDYPHGNCNYPDAWPAVLASLNGVPADERHLICAGNAIRLYGFGR